MNRYITNVFRGTFLSALFVIPPIYVAQAPAQAPAPASALASAQATAETTAGATEQAPPGNWAWD